MCACRWVREEELIPFFQHLFNARRVSDVTPERVDRRQDMDRESQHVQGRAALPGTRNAEDHVFWLIPESWRVLPSGAGQRAATGTWPLI